MECHIKNNIIFQSVPSPRRGDGRNISWLFPCLSVGTRRKSAGIPCTPITQYLGRLLRYIYSKAFFILFSILITGIPVYADIYVYVDKEGVMHFTNVPTSPKYKIYLKDRRSSSSSYDDSSSSSSSSSSLYWTDRYDHLINEAAGKYGVPFSLVKAIIKAESNFNPKAVSRAGARGLMQIMPDNFSLLQIDDPFDPWENIRGGTRYFRSLLDRFNWELSLALAGYNAGPQRVVQYNGIPPIRETQDYVKRVKKYYRILKPDVASE